MKCNAMRKPPYVDNGIQVGYIGYVMDIVKHVNLPMFYVRLKMLIFFFKKKKNDILGIRLFDFDTCLVDNRAVGCHGMGLARALGSELDPIFESILNFMNENPNEVITIEFGDVDGDAAIISEYIQSKLAQYFINGTGHSMMYVKKDPNDPWPTLREMIRDNTRIVVFFGRIYNNLKNREPWIQDTDFWFTASYNYTYNDMTSDQLVNSFTDWCNSAEEIIKDDEQLYGKVKWQTIDGT